MRNLHFLFILNIFFVILPHQLLIPSCLLYSSLTYSSCYSATATVGEDITAPLMKRHRCYCKLSLLILLQSSSQVSRIPRSFRKIKCCSRKKNSLRLLQILFLLILLSYVTKLGSVFPIIMEGGLPLNALLERCLDLIVDFHLLFLL